MDKKVVYLIVCIFACVIMMIIILSAPDKDNIQYAESGDVDIIVSLSSQTIGVNYTSLKGTLALTNIGKNTIYVSQYFEMGDEIQFILINSVSNICSSVVTFDVPEDKPIQLQPNGSIYFDFDMSQYSFYLNNTRINQLPEGEYAFYANYLNRFQSNIIEIKVIG